MFATVVPERAVAKFTIVLHSFSDISSTHAHVLIVTLDASVVAVLISPIFPMRS